MLYSPRYQHFWNIILPIKWDITNILSPRSIWYLTLCLNIYIKDFNVDYEEKEMDSTFRDMFVPPLARTEANPKVSNVKVELLFSDWNNKGDGYRLYILAVYTADGKVINNINFK